MGFRVRLSNLGFPGGSDSKASAYNAGDLGSIPGLGRSPGEGNGNPLRYSCLENPMDRGTWLGYSPWGCKESGMTEQLHSLRGFQSRRQWQSTPVLLPGKSHGRRSLVGYSPWGCKESDMTKRLPFLSFFLSFFQTCGIRKIITLNAIL